MLLGCCAEETAPPAPPPLTDLSGGPGALSHGAPWERAGEQAALRPAACQENFRCNALGLTGRCCPTVEGIMLGCCSRLAEAAGT